MTVTTRRLRIVRVAWLVALSSLPAAYAAPPEPSVVSSPPAAKAAAQRQAVLALRQLNFYRTPGFYEAHLAPGVSAALRNERVVGIDDYASSWADRSTQDPAAASRVGTRALRALERGLKHYAIERLEAEGLTLQVLQGRSHRGATLPEDSRGARLQLGVSSLAPRADLLIPVDAGRVVVSADARLRLTTTFESAAFGFRLAAKIDVPARTAVIGLGLRF
jgi:hypothetical protein